MFGIGSTRFEANYTVNRWEYHPGERVHDVDIPPLSTIVLVFRSNGPLKSGFIELSPNSGAMRSDFATSFFFQIREQEAGEERVAGLGDLTDSIGIAPSDFGWHFVIPIAVFSSGGVNTGIAYSHIPTTSRVQVVFELRNRSGHRLAIEDNIIIWEDNVWIEPYHKAQFVTEIFPDLFYGHENWDRTLYGSLHIYAQRNINVMALRMDIGKDANGKIRCPARERNNARRGQGKRVQDRVSRPTGRQRERVAWQRAEERAHWEQLQRRRGKALGELEKTEQAGVVGALRASPAAAGTVVERLPRGVGTLPGGVGGPATLGAGFVGKRAFRSGAGNREQGGRRNGRGRRRGRTGSYWILTVVLTNFTDSSTRCWRSGWSRCGRSTESWLTRR